MQYCGGKLYLLVSGPGGYIKLLLVEIQKDELVTKVVAMYRLPYSKQRWITSSVLLISIIRERAPLLSLVCGDRSGSLHLFQDGTEVGRNYLNLIFWRLIKLDHFSKLNRKFLNNVLPKMITLHCLFYVSFFRAIEHNPGLLHCS